MNNEQYYLTEYKMVTNAEIRRFMINITLLYKGIIKINFLLCLLFITLSCNKNDNNDDVVDTKIRVGVFGGSVSSVPESEAAKNIWKASLDIDIVSCGVGGAGFSSLTDNNVPSQIEKAEIFDVYILWASTNDVVKNAEDDLILNDETTQSGGILKSMNMIRQKNSHALILFFTSLPRFDYDIYYDRIPHFVDHQIMLCEKEQIPYLDQYSLCHFDKSNYEQYYLEDRVHLNEMGYVSIAMMQMEFIRENMNEHTFR